MNLTGKTFRALGNPNAGGARTATAMTFLSEAAGKVTGVCSGHAIWTGQIIARRTGKATLEMLYQCITVAGDLQAGLGYASFRDGPDMRPRMHLEWQWRVGTLGQGATVWVLADD